MVNIGPQHPSNPRGVPNARHLRWRGGHRDVEPDIRIPASEGRKSSAEERTYTQVITLTDRLDYLASMSNNLAYVHRRREAGMDIEAAGAGPSTSAWSCRRAPCVSPATAWSTQASSSNDLGALATPLMYMLSRARKAYWTCSRLVCGARITCELSCAPGGVFAATLPDEFMARASTSS